MVWIIYYYCFEDKWSLANSIVYNNVIKRVKLQRRYFLAKIIQMYSEVYFKQYSKELGRKFSFSARESYLPSTVLLNLETFRCCPEFNFVRNMLGFFPTDLWGSLDVCPYATLTIDFYHFQHKLSPKRFSNAPLHVFKTIRFNLQIFM